MVFVAGFLTGAVWLFAMRVQLLLSPARVLRSVAVPVWESLQARCSRHSVGAWRCVAWLTSRDVIDHAENERENQCRKCRNGAVSALSLWERPAQSPVHEGSEVFESQRRAGRHPCRKGSGRPRK